MAVKFNPFTGQLQIDEKGSGGGAQYIDGEVAVYADLSLDAGVAPLNSAWLVREASGIWPVSRKQAGIYIRTATAGSSRDADYTYAGTMPDVFSDAVFTLYDEASTTRTGQFNLGNITAGQNRVLTWPDGNGTIARTSDIPSTFAASAITSGVFDNARINFAAPSAIGSTTASSGAFTTLTGSTQIVGPQGSTVGSLSSCAISFGAANTGFNISNDQLAAVKQGSTVWYANNSSRFVVAAAMSNGLDIEATGAPLNFSARTSLQPEANNVLALRSGTNAQEYRVYNTFTNTTNFERGFMRWSSNVLQIGTEKLGTGSARALELQTDGTTRITIGATSGNVVCGGSLSVVTNLVFQGNASIQGNIGAGILRLLDNAATSFDRLQFGGGTSSFPALKRSSTTLQVRLADDSAFAAFECAGLTLNGNLTASTRNIVTDTTTGTRIGTGTTQLLGFWNATPAAQPAAVADATDAATVITQLNALLSRLRTIGIIAT